MDEQYYTLDTALFDGRFRAFGDDPVHVRGKVHQSDEQANEPFLPEWPEGE